ncbi:MULTISPECIES: hypothetical protein [Maricaulis]|uniref:hypothetical protein n=1 Tax=Maricaulis TaxID=74317 RepID=UPI000ADCB302|nr:MULTISPECIES: hypothetical protein [Maricaulis]
MKLQITGGYGFIGSAAARAARARDDAFDKVRIGDAALHGTVGAVPSSRLVLAGT